MGAKEEMIDKLRAKMVREGVTNIEAKVGDAYHLPLPDHSVDVAFMVTVLPEVPNRQRALRELRRVLKPDGILSLSDWEINSRGRAWTRAPWDGLGPQT